MVLGAVALKFISKCWHSLASNNAAAPECPHTHAQEHAASGISRACALFPCHFTRYLFSTLTRTPASKSPTSRFRLRCFRACARVHVCYPLSWFLAFWRTLLLISYRYNVRACISVYASLTSSQYERAFLPFGSRQRKEKLFIAIAWLCFAALFEGKRWDELMLYHHALECFQWGT